MLSAFFQPASGSVLDVMVGKAWRTAWSGTILEHDLDYRRGPFVELDVLRQMQK